MNGGHSFSGYSCTSGLQLHLDYFSDVISFNMENMTSAIITVQSGMRLGRLYGSILEITAGINTENLTYVMGGGTCATVGVTGHVLCGGYGMLGRELGLTSDQVAGFQVVTAQGELVTADATTNTDLFWALRGSCSSAFGVVVSVSFRLQRVETTKMTAFEYHVARLDNMIQVAQWFQTYGSLKAPSKLTLTLTFNNNFTSYIKGIFISTYSFHYLLDDNVIQEFI